MKLVVLIFSAVLLMGCSPQVIHLAQLNAGMTRAQVEDVQGQPDTVETSGEYTAMRYGTNYWVILEKNIVIATGSGTLDKYPGTNRYFINESYD
jgi:hypothetical protein